MNKIETLKATIINLENGMEYGWYNGSCCNCGVVATTILGKNSVINFLNSPLIDPLERGAFSRYAYCMTTNLPLPLVFLKLKDAGFSHQDLLHLEYLGNKEILDKMGQEQYIRHEQEFVLETISTSYKDRNNLISYLKAWVEILEEEESNVPSEVKIEASKEAPTPIAREKTVYVSVPESIVTIAEIVLS